MALGTMTLVESVASDGPLFIDRVTLVGDSAYTGGGSTGVAGKLQALKKDKREIMAVFSEDLNLVQYDKANEKLKVNLEDQTSGVTAEAGSSNQSSSTYHLTIISK